MALNSLSLGTSLTKGCGLLVCLLMFLSLTAETRAQQDERAVRAAYLFNLSKYVTWPGETNELRICTLPDEQTGEHLKQILDGKISNGRAVRVVVAPGGAEQRRCAIFYFGDATAGKCVGTLRALGDLPVLTVGNNPQFVRSGGMVGLIRADDQIQLRVNVSAVRNAGIQMSSRLLSIAVIVRAGGAK